MPAGPAVPGAARKRCPSPVHLGFCVSNEGEADASLILIAVGGSAAGPNAVETTAELASLTGATVRVLHIDTSDAVYDAVIPLENDVSARGTLYGAMSARRQAGVQADGEPLDGLVSDVAPAVEEAARRFGADLIVVSPHHRGRLASCFTPSVGDAIVRSGETPLLLAPASN